MTPDYKARKRGEPIMPIEQRLRSKVEINSVSGCWEWVGAKRRGYGRLTVGSRVDGSRRSVSAHRLSYELTCGEIPSGMYVCHRCDNPSCINPEHLFLGSLQDNIKDREKKRRNITFVGEELHNAKLTRKDVRDARWERTYRGTSFQKIADKYGVSKKTIQSAIAGETWKCVPYFPAPPEEGAEHEQD